MRGLKVEGYKGEFVRYDFKKISQAIRKRTYPCLGMGSGRVVFDMEDGSVVKVAKNRRGVAQNEAEYKIGLEDPSHLFAKVFAVSERFTFLIMEKAKRINRISGVWEYFQVKSNKELYKVEELSEVCERNNLEIKDFGRAANWGQIKDRPVIIDYGFTKQVRRRYYMSPAANFIYKIFG